MTKKLTREQHAMIAAAWLNLAPHLGKFDNTSLLKINGPIVSGINFKPSAGRDGYVPKGHIHNLCSGLSFLSLELEVSGRPLRMSEHEGGYEREFARICSELPVVGDARVSSDDVFSAYVKFLRGKKFPDVEGYLATLVHMTRLATWCGFDVLASSLQSAVQRRVDALPSDRGDHPAILRWHDFCRSVPTRDEMARVVEEAITDLRLERIPHHDFVIGDPPAWAPSEVVP